MLPKHTHAQNTDTHTLGLTVDYLRQRSILQTPRHRARSGVALLRAGATAYKLTCVV